MPLRRVHSCIAAAVPWPLIVAILVCAIAPQAYSQGGQEIGSTPIVAPMAPPALSAAQIIQMLQESPSLRTELKTELADRMTQANMPVDPESISDAMLYQQISTNAGLRASITSVLRARGLSATGDSSPVELPTLPSENVAPGRRDAAGTKLGFETGIGAPSGTFREPRAADTAHASTDLPRVHNLPTPVDLPSLHDLYTQITNAPAALQRFGSDVFWNRNGLAAAPGVSGLDAPPDAPLGPGYVVEPGDALSIELWGGVTQNLVRVVGRDGRILLPEAGSLAVAGLKLGNLQGLIGSALRQQFRNAHVAVTVTRLHSVRIYIVGDVQQPGGYDISALATPLSALYAAGGPTAVGSLRTLLHYRGQRLVQKVDLYDFLLHGIQAPNMRFESGDTLFVPPAGRQVAIFGAVKRPAIYELKDGTTSLAALIKDAGGLTAAAAPGRIRIERINARHQRVTVTLPAAASDTLRRPSRLCGGGIEAEAWGSLPGPSPSPGIDTGLSAHSADPGAARGRRPTGGGGGEAPGKDRPCLPAGKALGSAAAMASFAVEDGDRIQIEPILPYSQQAIYLMGHVARPGRLPYRAGMRLSDVIRSYRDLLPEPADRGEILRLVPPDLHAAVIDFNVPGLFGGRADPELEPFDTIRIFGRYQEDAPRVTVLGEVMHPGTYPMPRGMTAADLVRLAGGFKRDALRASADLTSYVLAQGQRAVENVSTVRIEAALSGTAPHADVRLKPGDVLMIHQITNWNDIGETITIQGQVRYPGTYGFKEGERLSALLRRAGGMLPSAYPLGAVLTREQVRDLQQKSRKELIREIDTSSAAARMTPGLAGGNTAEMLQLIQAQQNQVLADLKSRPPTGRMVIHISAGIDSWANTPADIEVRRGDVLTIPKRPGFVLITGQVFNPTALTFVPGKSAQWYLRRAGGSNSTADQKDIFIIHANGAVVGRGSRGWLRGGVLATKLNPGDVLVVPRKIIGGSAFWRNLLSTGQLAASIAISARVAAAAL